MSNNVISSEDFDDPTPTKVEKWGMFMSASELLGLQEEDIYANDQETQPYGVEEEAYEATSPKRAMSSEALDELDVLSLEDLKEASKKNKPTKVADKILRENNILYAAQEFYRYEEGLYKVFDENRVKKMVKDIIKIKYSINWAREVIDAMKAEVFLETEELNNTPYLNLKNGLFDLETFELRPHTPDVYSTIQLAVSYDPEARCEGWIRALYEIFQGSKDKIDMLQEFFGLCLTREMKYERALICIGDGANGKSVVLHILQEMLGRENYSAVPLEQFKNSHYLVDLFGRLANISTETNAKSSDYDSSFKQIVTGDIVQADAKYKKPVKFRPFCKLVFAMNNMPRIDDKTSAFYRRLVILRFKRQFKEEEQDKDLKHKLEEELNGIFLWSLRGLERLRSRGRFELSDDMEKEIDEYRRQNNNVRIFAEEECSFCADFGISKDRLYTYYHEWAKNNGYMPLSKVNFGRELMSQYKTVGERRTATERFWEGITYIGGKDYDTEGMPF
jgi:putative DNA primase/helicase